MCYLIVLDDSNYVLFQTLSNLYKFLCLRAILCCYYRQIEFSAVLLSFPFRIKRNVARVLSASNGILFVYQ